MDAIPKITKKHRLFKFIKRNKVRDSRLTWRLINHSISDQSGLATGEKLWLGVTDVAQEGVFVWDHNGKQLTYSDWDTNQPNNWGDQDYVDYKFGYGWQDDKSFRNYGAICEYKTSRYSR